MIQIINQNNHVSHFHISQRIFVNDHQTVNSIGIFVSLLFSLAIVLVFVLLPLIFYNYYYYDDYYLLFLLAIGFPVAVVVVVFAGFLCRLFRMFLFLILR